MESIEQAARQYPLPEGSAVSYGTAGFRGPADALEGVFFRTALTAVLRSRSLRGQTIGIMITASHNPANDNGIKIVDPLGEMLEAKWEEYAGAMVRVPDSGLLATLQSIVSATKTDIASPAHLALAWDTRASSDRLASIIADGARAFGATVTTFGLLTTPQLHYVTRCLNTQGTALEYGEPTEAGYYDKLSRTYLTLMESHRPAGLCIVDCANGVGALKLKALADRIGPDALRVQLINTDVTTAHKLNYQCGADYVKTNQRAPPSATPIPALQRCASFDGDADRIVYYYTSEDGKLCLLDGDKIAGLVCMYVKDLVRMAATGWTVGVVQTAYANGSSTQYLEKVLQVPVECVPTGVKYLHHAAQRFDCGIYFEANGHGTVLFSSEAVAHLETYVPQSPAQYSAQQSLRKLIDLVNQTTGDALSDMLLIEMILAQKGWDTREWDAAYTDLPSRLMRVTVPDRSVYVTTNAERQLVSPEGVQARIDALVAKYKHGRAFVRASGTENAVRVYAEAATRGEADELAFKVADLLA